MDCNTCFLLIILFLDSFFMTILNKYLWVGLKILNFHGPQSPLSFALIFPLPCQLLNDHPPSSIFSHPEECLRCTPFTTVIIFFLRYWGVLNKSSYLQYFPPINLSFYCWSNENVLLQNVILWVILHVVLLDPLGKKSNFLMLKYLYRYYLFIIYHTCYTIILWAQQPCICISLL